MSNDLIKRPGPKRPDPTIPEQDAASRLKGELMADALDAMFGNDDDKPAAVPGAGERPRVILALANYGHRRGGWDYAKVLQREMFEAAGGNLEMKFGFYAQENNAGVRKCRITTRWISDADDMGNVMGRAECNCGCYVNVRDVLGQAVKENEDRPVQAMVLIVDSIHDGAYPGAPSLDEAAILANQLRRAGTKLFLIQEGADPHTAHNLKYLAKVSGAVYFQFDPRTQERQLAEMVEMVSVFAAGGENAVKAKGGEAATLLLEHLKQEPMPILEKEPERVKVKR